MRFDEAAALYLGSTELTSLYLGDFELWSATPPGGGGDPVIVAFDNGAMTATASPVVTIDGYDPVEGDVVFVAPYSTSSATLSTLIADWVNVLGGTTLSTPGDGTVALACVGHAITAPEAAGNVNSWTFTDLWNTAETGEYLAVVVRNADASAFVDAAAAQFNVSPVTPHLLAGLAGANVSTGSLPISFVAPDAFGTYPTPPSGWSNVGASTGTNQGGAVFVRDTLTTAGVDVTETAVTPSGSDEYASITVAVARAA